MPKIFEYFGFTQKIPPALPPKLREYFFHGLQEGYNPAHPNKVQATASGSTAPRFPIPQLSPYIFVTL